MLDFKVLLFIQFFILFNYLFISTWTASWKCHIEHFVRAFCDQAPIKTGTPACHSMQEQEQMTALKTKALHLFYFTNNFACHYTCSLKCISPLIKCTLQKTKQTKKKLNWKILLLYKVSQMQRLVNMIEYVAACFIIFQGCKYKLQCINDMQLFSSVYWKDFNRVTVY